MYKEIKKCRLCGCPDLITLIDLGNLALTGVFPSKGEIVPRSPLELVKCEGACELVQLRHTYSLEQMYGDNYGYRSGLNNSMVKHLNHLVNKMIKYIPLKDEDIVIDIGSNDCTLLKAYPEKIKLNKLGIDPTAEKFKQYYPEDTLLSANFFSSDAIKQIFPNKKAKIITAVAMFYDLEDPLQFAQQVYECLDDEGVWLIEQSYMPFMLTNNAYDTICHEHLEYYGLKQIKYIADKVGFKIINIEFNDTNGGSFAVAMVKKESSFKEQFIPTETIMPYDTFRKNVEKHKEDLLTFLDKQTKVLGYGASTKGNVILQYCDITEKQLPYIGEVNEYKFGRYTPGTNIPIIPEKEAKEMNPDYLMVLPWHFKNVIVSKEKAYLQKGGKLFFPLPYMDIIVKKEKGPEYYDNVNRIPKTLKPTWVNLYNKIIEQIPQDSAVVDLGCGPGLFAEFLYRAGFKDYLGIDFSSKCVEIAQCRIPSYTFEVDNLYDSSNAKFLNYDVFVLVEVLEHLSDDLAVINSIPIGKKIIFSVPNRHDIAHVRFFDNPEEIKQRFDKYIKFDKILTINGGGVKRFFIGVGERYDK